MKTGRFVLCLGLNYFDDLLISLSLTGVQNLPTWGQKSINWRPKSTKIRPKMVPWGFLEASWGHLRCKFGVLGSYWLQFGASWADLGSKLGGLGPILVPSWRPKCSKNRSWGDPIGFLFGVHLGQWYWVRFCTNLAPIWIPKPSQNGAKSGSKSILF